MTPDPTDIQKGRDLANNLRRTARRKARAGDETAAAAHVWLARLLDDAANEAENKKEVTP